MTRPVGLTGLATMGRNFARNLLGHGMPLVVHNRTYARTEELLRDHGAEGDLRGVETLPELVGALDHPRVVLMMVKTGSPVDDVIVELVEHLDPGDVLADLGNSFWEDTERRSQLAHEHGIHYLGVGVSGGAEGARHGPSLMVGGDEEAWDLLADVLRAVAADAEDGEPCCAYLGPGGAGHYVKMVHNGIEYADMQLLAEAYDVLRTGLGFDADAAASVFGHWDEGELASFLTRITAELLTVPDADGDGRLVDAVLDRGAQKGTGRQTAQSALELGIPATTTAEAVFARSLSAQRPLRIEASGILRGPDGSLAAGASTDETVGALGDALYAARIVAYAQGFALLDAQQAERGWNLDLGTVAAIWRAGCIIRARLLEDILEIYRGGERPAHLLLAPELARALDTRQDAWRRVVADAVRAGIPVPALASALTFHDGLRRSRLPTNLTQAQRDRFGDHGFERVDRDGSFHADWVPASRS